MWQDLVAQLAKSAPLAEEWHTLAETRCKAAGERLTRSRLAVYAELLANDRPVSAYELIALLEKRQDRKIAPLTVYRQLNFLERMGLVHRVQTAHTYLPCKHPGHAHESQFLVCSSCGSVDEVRSAEFDVPLRQIVKQRGFRPDDVVIEVKGLCNECTTDENE